MTHRLKFHPRLWSEPSGHVVYPLSESSHFRGWYLNLKSFPLPAEFGKSLQFADPNFFILDPPKRKSYLQQSNLEVPSQILRLPLSFSKSPPIGLGWCGQMVDATLVFASWPWVPPISAETLAIFEQNTGNLYEFLRFMLEILVVL